MTSEQLKRRENVPGKKSTRWLGNYNKKKVHDLDEEVEPCSIELMNLSDYARHFPTKAEANDAGYDDCDWCIGQLGKKHGYDKI